MKKFLYANFPVAVITGLHWIIPLSVLLALIAAIYTFIPAPPKMDDSSWRAYGIVICTIVCGIYTIVWWITRGLNLGRVPHLSGFQGITRIGYTVFSVVAINFPSWLILKLNTDKFSDIDSFFYGISIYWLIVGIISIFTYYISAFGIRITLLSIPIFVLLVGGSAWLTYLVSLLTEPSMSSHSDETLSRIWISFALVWLLILIGSAFRTLVTKRRRFIPLSLAATFTFGLPAIYALFAMFWTFWNFFLFENRGTALDYYDNSFVFDTGHYMFFHGALLMLAATPFFQLMKNRIRSLPS